MTSEEVTFLREKLQESEAKNEKLLGELSKVLELVETIDGDLPNMLTAMVKTAINNSEFENIRMIRQ